MIGRRIKAEDLFNELHEVGVDAKAFGIFRNKSEVILLRFYNVDARGANILKQEFLSSGGDVALHRDVASFKIEKTDIITMGTKKTYNAVIEKLKLEQYFGLKEVREALLKMLETPKIPSYKIRGQTLDFENHRYLMGILNVTPDSFSDGGKFMTLNVALEHSGKMIEEGADIIDIGGESTRPGAEPVEEEEERRRVIPVIKEIRKCFKDVIISIDTYRSAIAREALSCGADIVNDISGLRFDPEMINVVADFDVPVVIMHIKGTPKDMQRNPVYEDLMKELLEYFNERIDTLNKQGVEQIIIDPGIGFGKELDDNLQIIKYLKAFTIFSLPILIGTSRKSFIGHITGESIEERLTGTLAANSIALVNGANILRVHDVKPHKELIKTFEAIIGARHRKGKKERENG